MADKLGAGSVVATSDYDMGALVFDLGRRTFRIGSAGDDGPAFELPSRVGYFPNAETAEERNETITSSHHKISAGISSAPSLDAGEIAESLNLNSFSNTNTPAVKHQWNRKKYRFCRHPISQLLPTANMEIKSYLSPVDSTVVDWDTFENVMHYVFTDCLRQNSNTSPMLFTETPIVSPTTLKAREKMVEILFEKFRAPAVCLCRSPVLACFANGKTSGLVLDLGADSSTCTPVHEGFSMYRQFGLQTPVGGSLLVDECRHLLQTGLLCPKMGGEIVPPYLIASKESTLGTGLPPKFTRRQLATNPTPSYHYTMVEAVVEEFKHACVRISELPIQDANPATIPLTEFEFPNGYRHEFTTEVLHIGESLFDPSRLAVTGQRGETISSMLGISNIVSAVLNKMEPELRNHISNTLIVTGGQAAMPGMLDRLQREVNAKSVSGIRLKVAPSPTTSDARERMNAAWIGGSILGSLSSFHSLWFTKQDYEAGEGRLAAFHKKCP